jgi:hypothetical protein
VPPPRSPPSPKKRFFGQTSLGLGVVGVVAFVIFILVYEGLLLGKPGPFIACYANNCSARSRFVFNWFPAVIALACIAGGIFGFRGGAGSRLGRIGFGLAVLNGLLAVAAFIIWLSVSMELSQID